MDGITAIEPHEGAAEGASVFDRLRRDILAGRLDASGRLKVSELAVRYGTSTNPVREALQQLRGEGLVVIEPNRGARLRAIDEAFVRDIHEIEMLLEPWLTRGFVGLCTAADLSRLEALQAAMEALAFADAAEHNRLDSAFHLAMYGRHTNRHAVDLWWRHREILRAINLDHDTALKRRRDVMVEHRALLDALRAHDEDRAAAVIAAHVQGSGAHTIDWLRARRPRRQGPRP